MFRTPQDIRLEGEEHLNSLERDATELNLPIFIEGPPPSITIQPTIGGESSHISGRRPIPVSTIEWGTSSVSQFIPMQGLDFLAGTDQLYIQQTVELNDLLASIESENRYTIKVPHGETLYYATETSTDFQRMCFGASRSFTMRLFDQTQQQALEFKRRLAFGGCSFWCYLQQLEVWVPPGDLIGIIRQEPALAAPVFLVCNSYFNTIYRIEGPSTCACLMSVKDAHFKIYSADGMTQLGSISHQWDQVQVSYNLSVHFPGRSVDTRHKALLLGAAFLLEYMYFERAKKKSCCRCAC